MRIENAEGRRFYEIEERNETVTNCHGLKTTEADGNMFIPLIFAKFYENTEWLWELVYSIIASILP